MVEVPLSGIIHKSQFNRELTAIKTRITATPTKKPKRFRYLSLLYLVFPFLLNKPCISVGQQNRNATTGKQAAMQVIPASPGGNPTANSAQILKTFSKNTLRSAGKNTIKAIFRLILSK
ncbi:MAG: hypothetical protein U9Q92_07150 [archaeon]|nr:hypothetical protein [archaeon]